MNKNKSNKEIKLNKSKRIKYWLKKDKGKNFFLAIFIIFTFSFTTFVSFTNYAEAKANKKEEIYLLQECENIKEDIAEKKEIVNGERFDEYCEKIAREKYGYCKPGEKVYYYNIY